MKGRWFRKGLKVLTIVALATTVGGAVVMGLWNWLAPSVFGLRAITFWQALGLLILSKILFGGFRGRSGPGRHWKHRMNERWLKMTPEERENFRQGVFSRCGHTGGSAEGSPEARAV